MEDFVFAITISFKFSLLIFLRVLKVFKKNLSTIRINLSAVKYTVTKVHEVQRWSVEKYWSTILKCKVVK